MLPVKEFALCIRQYKFLYDDHVRRFPFFSLEFINIWIRLLIFQNLLHSWC
jgi:hypothetical protein